MRKSEINTQYVIMKHAFFFLMILFIYFERGERREKELERNINVSLPLPGMCPEWELNQQPLGSEAGIQFTEPHQSGHEACF